MQKKASNILQLIIRKYKKKLLHEIQMIKIENFFECAFFKIA